MSGNEAELVWRDQVTMSFVCRGVLATSTGDGWESLVDLQAAEKDRILYLKR